MIAWLTTVLSTFSALAADDGALPADPVILDEDRADRRPARERRIRMVPLRLDTRAAFRDGLGVGMLVELGFQAVRTRSLTLDLNAAFVTPRQVLIPGPDRSWFTWELSSDALVPATRWLAIGPTGGLALRFYQQQGMDIDQGWTPFLGVRANTTVVRARKWSVALGTRLASDLAATRLVMETQQVVDVFPVEAQVGLRINFGHGPEPKPKVQP